MIWECPLKWATPPKSLVFWSTRAEQRKQLANLVTPDSILIRMPHSWPYIFQSRNHMKDGVVQGHWEYWEYWDKLQLVHDLNTATRSEHCYGVPWSLCFMCEIVDVESSLDLFERTTIESQIRKYGDCMWSFLCWRCLFMLVSLLNLFLYSTLFHCLRSSKGWRCRAGGIRCWDHRSHTIGPFASALLTQVGQPRAAAVDAAELVIIWLIYG